MNSVNTNQPVRGGYGAYASYAANAGQITDSAADTIGKAANTEEEAAAKSRTDSYESSQAQNATETENVYKPNAELVSQLKQDLENQKTRFLDTVKDMLNKQGIQIAEGDGVWRQIAQGNFSVDAETAAAAKESISEGGYWSPEKTSERLISYAKALTGGDPSKAEAMREAFLKGFEEAEKAWGGSLPDITQKTYDLTMKAFDDWASEADQ